LFTFDNVIPTDTNTPAVTLVADWLWQ